MMKPVVHQYEDKLLEFAYGELPAHEESAVSAHVKSCAKCSDALAGIKGVRASMRQLPMEQAPDAGLESLLAYAEQAAQRHQQGPAKKRGLFSKWVGALSAVAAVSVVGYVTVSSSLKAPDLAGAVTAAKQAELKSEREEQLNDRQRAAPSKTAPIVAAAPEAQPAKEQQADGKLRAPGGGAFGKDFAKADEAELEKSYRRGEGTSMPSLSRRDKAAKNTVAEADDGLLGTRREDFSNAAARGGREPSQAYLGQDKVAGKPTDALEKTAAPASPKPAAKENKSLGLSSGDLAYKEEDAWAQGSGEGARVAAGPKDAPPPAPAASAAPAATSVKGSLDGLGGLGSTGNVSPQRESLGLSVKSKKSSKAMAPSADAPELNDEVAANSENRVQSSRKFDDDAMNGPASEESEQAQKVEAALGQARQAAKAGDRQGEVNAALAVLKAGATGYQRTEALKRLCDAFEAEGNQGSADAYCGMLLQEFPNTVAAKTVVTRRAARERALQEDAKNAGAKSKAKAAPSEAVPAKAY